MTPGDILLCLFGVLTLCYGVLFAVIIAHLPKEPDKK